MEFSAIYDAQLFATFLRQNSLAQSHEKGAQLFIGLCGP
jgi:hypothetical protein